MLVLDDEFVKAADMSESELKLELAIWLYQTSKVSLRRASKMINMHWLDFSKILSERNIVTIKMTEEDLQSEIKTVNSLLK